MIDVAAQPAPAAGGHATRRLTVTSINIHHAEGTDGVSDLSRIAQVIKDNRADVVGLQVDRRYSVAADGPTSRPDWRQCWDITELVHSGPIGSDHLPLISQLAVSG